MRIRYKIMIMSIAVLAGALLLTHIKGEAANSPLGTCYYLYENQDCLKSGGTLKYKDWADFSKISINEDGTLTALDQGYGVPFGVWYEFEQSFCFQSFVIKDVGSIVYAGTKKQGFKNLSKTTIPGQFVYPGCWYLAKARRQTECPWLFDQTMVGRGETFAQEEEVAENEESEEEIEAGFLKLKEKWTELFEQTR